MTHAMRTDLVASLIAEKVSAGPVARARLEREMKQRHGVNRCQFDAGLALARAAQKIRMTFGGSAIERMPR